MLNRILIISVFIVASCGLAYELIASALSSYLLGDSILQFSSVIGCYLFAMGIGSHLSQYVKDEDSLEYFINIELLIGLIGGISALLLFVIFTWTHASFRSVLYLMVLLIGILVGMEIPLVMRVLHQQNIDFKRMVSRVLTFDYLGALAVSLLFPLILAPQLGMSRTALLFGLLNVIVAIIAIACFRHNLKQTSTLIAKAIVILIVLTSAFVYANRITHWAEQNYVSDPIIYSQSSPYQRIVLTRWHDELRLFLNGNLQFSSADEHRYHEALVLPVMENRPNAKQVLILGGGDGLAVREVLKYPNVEKITLVDLDTAVTQLFQTSPDLIALNQNSLNHPKVNIINADAGQWLETVSTTFDIIIVDLPDPSNFALGKLYSVPMYKQLIKHLTSNGLVVIQSTSPYHAPHAYWCIVETLKAAGLHTWPYHLYIPSFGDWGYVIAARQAADFGPPAHYRAATRYLTPENTASLFHFPKDMPKPSVTANTLNTQILVHYFESDWQKVIR